jgi:hypothetical protein
VVGAEGSANEVPASKTFLIDADRETVLGITNAAFGRFATEQGGTDASDPPWVVVPNDTKEDDFVGTLTFVHEAESRGKVVIVSQSGPSSR